MNKGRLLVLVGSLLLIVGGFLPWISVPDLFGLSGPSYEGIEVGWEGDRVLMTGVGLILVLSQLLFGGVARRWITLTGVVLAALAAPMVVLVCRASVDYFLIYQVKEAFLIIHSPQTL